MNSRFTFGWEHVRGHVSRAWSGILGSADNPKVSPELTPSDAERVRRRGGIA